MHSRISQTPLIALRGYYRDVFEQEAGELSDTLRKRLRLQRA